MQRRKTFLFIISFTFAFFLLVPEAKASLLVVKPNGEVVLNVLADQDESTLTIPQNEELKITDVVAYAADVNSQISLTKSNDSVVLSVASESGERTLDVTDFGEEIIEIEERPQTERFTISVKDGEFSIEQEGIKATTQYEITVDPQRARLLLDAPSGKRFLSISPKVATQTLLRAKTLNRFTKEGSISIVEKDGSDLMYRVVGDKVLNLFDLYSYPVEVTAYVSALTGEIVSVDQPQWLRVLGFLFA